MAASSSTSNSDRATAPRVPWALILAVAIVVIVEAMLRLRNPHKLIAYPDLAASDDQTVTYTAVRQYVETDGPAEIALIGSSQVREGISMPTLMPELAAKLPGMRVANYALRGSRVDSMEAVAHFLAKQPQPPKLVVIGISVRDLRGEDPDWPRMAVFWDFPTWRREARYSAAQVAAVFPVVLRSAAAEVCDTQRYREQLSMDLSNLVLPASAKYRRDGNPIVGEITWQNTGGRGARRLDLSPIRRTKLLETARKSYAWEQPAAPSKAMMARLKTMIGELKSRGVKVLLVEMPVADLLQRELAKVGMARKFDDAVGRLAAEENVPFIRAEEQPMKMTDEYFIDLQHHNRVGGELFAKWLAGEIVAIISGTPTTRPTTYP